MQRVSLYTARRKVVTSHSGYIPVASRTNPIIFSRNSPDAFLSEEVKVDHLPVRRFCFRQHDGSIENRFVAFDRELDEVIDCLIDEGVANVSKQCRSYIEEIAELRGEIKTLQGRSIWDTIKFKLKRVFKK